MVKIEVCANSVQSCIEAQQAGASGVELCDNMKEGGTTPSYAQIKLAKEKLAIDLNIIIRPRGSDFLYSDIEFDCMQEDIKQCGALGVHGVVFGILTQEGNIDIERNNILQKLATKYSLYTTFHRAIDRSNNMGQAMEDIIKIGFDRILTSGGRKNAIEGKDVIRKLIAKAQGRIIVMPGGGITEKNIAELVNHTGAKEIHGSFQHSVNSSMAYQLKEDELGKFGEEYTYLESSQSLIKAAIKTANKQ